MEFYTNIDISNDTRCLLKYDLNLLYCLVWWGGGKFYMLHVNSIVDGGLHWYKPYSEQVLVVDFLKMPKRVVKYICDNWTTRQVVTHITRENTI